MPSLYTSERLERQVKEKIETKQRQKRDNGETTRLPASMSSSIKTKGCFSFFLYYARKNTHLPNPKLNLDLDYGTSSLTLVYQKSNVNPKRALKSNLSRPGP